jgi:hypothetical protein
MKGLRKNLLNLAVGLTVLVTPFAAKANDVKFGDNAPGSNQGTIINDGEGVKGGNYVPGSQLGVGVNQNPTSTANPIQNGGGAKIEGVNSSGGSVDVEGTKIPTFQFGLGNNVQVKGVTGPNGSASFGGADFQFGTSDETYNVLGLFGKVKVSPTLPKNLNQAVENATAQQAVELGMFIDNLTPSQFLNTLTGLPIDQQRERILNAIASTGNTRLLEDFEKIQDLKTIKQLFRGQFAARVATQTAQKAALANQQETAKKKAVLKANIVRKLNRLWNQLFNFQRAGNTNGANETLLQIQNLQNQFSLI